MNVDMSNVMYFKRPTVIHHTSVLISIVLQSSIVLNIQIPTRFHETYYNWYLTNDGEVYHTWIQLIT